MDTAMAMADVVPGPTPVPSQWGLVVVALAVVLLVLVLMRSGGAGCDFRIKLRGGDVDVSGKRLSIALRNELLHFFKSDFPPKPRLTIYATRRRNRTYQLRFSGKVSPGEKQQVRNFLMARV